MRGVCQEINRQSCNLAKGNRQSYKRQKAKGKRQKAILRSCKIWEEFKVLLYQSDLVSRRFSLDQLYKDTKRVSTEAET
ncbi:hypothetical protein WN50_13875 [Limnoraphis robusta CS-951]|uniref:Transposase n=1 Tax=Limnoraphis robusta CS-951 TaxID=1637645 RepID=A0A0F5YFA2_9CYAN|nr:hypothetical protein WN50_13875 [Limnoraphis robusta CS-951]